MLKTPYVKKINREKGITGFVAMRKLLKEAEREKSIGF
jgi:hypothetical protein